VVHPSKSDNHRAHRGVTTTWHRVPDLHADELGEPRVGCLLLRALRQVGQSRQRCPLVVPRRQRLQALQRPAQRGARLGGCMTTAASRPPDENHVACSRCGLRLHDQQGGSAWPCFTAHCRGTGPHCLYWRRWMARESSACSDRPDSCAAAAAPSGCMAAKKRPTSSWCSRSRPVKEFCCYRVAHIKRRRG
jgi:hypothetical protein